MDIKALYEAVGTRYGLTVKLHLLSLASTVHARAETLEAMKLGMTEIVPPPPGPGERHVSEMVRAQVAETIPAVVAA